VYRCACGRVRGGGRACARGRSLTQVIIINIFLPSAAAEWAEVPIGRQPPRGTLDCIIEVPGQGGRRARARELACMRAWLRAHAHSHPHAHTYTVSLPHESPRSTQHRSVVRRPLCARRPAVWARGGRRRRAVLYSRLPCQDSDRLGHGNGFQILHALEPLVRNLYGKRSFSVTAPNTLGGNMKLVHPKSEGHSVLSHLFD
jgi:hypothetical protein